VIGVGTLSAPGPRTQEPAVTRLHRRARGALVVVAAIAITALLSGCAAGLDSTTTQPYDPTNGAQVTVGDINVENLLVVTGIDGGELYGGIVNGGAADDELTAVTVETSPPITLPQPIVLPADTNVALGPPGPNRIFIHDLGAQPGQLVHVTLTFRDAGTGETDVLVSTLENLAAGG
jgi:copper(I)-binding protein